MSLISPCYNGEKYVENFLNSVLNQTYNNIEFIFIDDGSTDKTKDIVLSYRDKLIIKGIDFIYMYQENKGQSSAVDLGLKLFKGEYLMCSDSDDILYPNNIKEKVEFLESNKKYGLVCCKGKVVTENTFKQKGILQRKLIDKEDNLFYDLIMCKNVYFAPIGYMMRTSMFLDTNPNRSIYCDKDVGQNWQLLLPITYKYKCGYIDKYLFDYVFREESHSHIKKTSSEKNKKINACEQVLINTINTIDMATIKKEKYIDLVKQQYEKKKENISNINNIDFSIIIAYKSDNGGLRGKHLKYNIKKYQKMFPNAEIIVSEDNENNNGWTGFNKSKCINSGVKRATKNNLLIIDADVVLSKETILDSLSVINEYSIIYPYTKLYHLKKETTEKILFESVDINLFNIYFNKKDYKGNLGVDCWKGASGGVCFITKENFYKAGGYDERFVGWGYEDTSFNKAVLTMCGDNYIRLNNEAYHLWHDKKRNVKTCTKNSTLYSSYEQAFNNKDKMLKLISHRYDIDFSIIVAYKSDNNGFRDKHLKWSIERYKLMFPNAEIIISEDKESDKNKDWIGFNKSKYINLGVQKTTKDILLITDIDMVFSKDAILEGLKNIDKYCYIVPYTKMLRTNNNVVNDILNNEPSCDLPKIDSKGYTTNHSVCKIGGCHIIKKENFYKAGGYDERFTDWGYEDVAFNYAIKTICDKPCLILNKEAYHLWHPVDGRKSFKTGNMQNNKKYKNEYRQLINNKEAMQDLILKNNEHNILNIKKYNNNCEDVNGNCYSDFLKNKNIVLVGSAGYLQGQNKGGWIDDFDVVVKMNNSIGVLSKKDYGCRSDILYHSLLKDIYSLSGKKPVNLYDIKNWLKHNVRYFVPRYHSESKKVKDFKKINNNQINIKYIDNEFRRDIKMEIKNKTPNTGVLAVAHLLSLPIKSLTVVGFDFYNSGVADGYDGFTNGKDAIGINEKRHDSKAQLEYLKKLYKEQNGRLIFDEIMLNLLNNT